jgi:hypothetical protein
LPVAIIRKSLNIRLSPGPQIIVGLSATPPIFPSSKKPIATCSPASLVRW